MGEKKEEIYIFRDFNDEDIKVFLPKFEIDMGTMKQIKEMSRHLILKHIRIMPDCHRGAGCCVGMTAEIHDRIYPRYVGFDIGCGISMYPLHISKNQLSESDKAVVNDIIYQAVPTGSGGRNANIQIKEADWEWLREKNNQHLESLKEKFQKEFPDYIFPEDMNREYILKVIQKIGGDANCDLKSIGSLGGGNHYIEVNIDSSDLENQRYYLTVHSGSRTLGSLICKYHQNKIDSNCRFDYEKFKHEMKNVRRKFRKAKTIHEAEIKIKEDMQSNLHPLYLEGDEMIDYLIDMIIGQNFASLNRIIMIRSIVTDLYIKTNLMKPGIVLISINDYIDDKEFIETKHKYIDFFRMMLRKGSISAEKNEKCIISLNMRDGILICQGKGNPDWNYSSAHGCGRIVQRGQVSKLSMTKFKEDMEGIYSTSIRKETLDESPMAYRNSDLVKKCVKGSVKILKQLKPVINCKGF